MTLADEINRMILKIVESLEITSANPTHTNTVIQANEMDKPDLEAMIASGTDDTSKKDNLKLNESVKKLDKFEKGNVGEIQRMTSSQIGNVKSLASNPAGFIMGTFIRKFTRGVGVLALALLIFEAVKIVIMELYKPGRWLDVRFKRDISKEIIAFRRREDQQKLRQGFSSIIITSMPRMRGSPNQAAQTTNTLDFARTNDTVFFANVGQDPMIYESAGLDRGKYKGRRGGRPGT